MKHCPTCSRTFEDAFTFCLVDGAILSAPFDQPSALIAPEHTLREPPTEAAAAVALPRPPVETSPQPTPFTHAARPSKKWWAIGGLGVALIAIGITLFVFAGRGSSLTRDEQGRTLRLQEKWAEAEKLYKEAASSEPNNALWHVRLGQLLHDQRKDAEGLAEGKEAERLARESLRSNPNDASAHGTLGAALRLQDKFTEAEAEDRIALQANPNDAEFNNGLGSSL
ncbi:MAG: Tetratricopeptide repeat [Acidobacteriota bacterium]|jgi:tetratricopeptide (TPR) repeat protein|nr:Tetratricopeptide repeat [Acidobacteriota bacterium]